MAIVGKINCGSLEPRDEKPQVEDGHSVVPSDEKPQVEDGHSVVCESKQDGIYPDYDSDCRKFFVCEKNQMYSFDCPLSTRFYERFESCSFVPPEEMDHFVCTTPNQLKESGNRQSLNRNGHSIDYDEPHVIDRRHDGRDRKDQNQDQNQKQVMSIHAIEVKSEHDLDYLKRILSQNQWLPASSHIQGEAYEGEPQTSEREERNSKFMIRTEMGDGEGDFHHHLKQQQQYHVVPIKGHGYQDHRSLESILSPLLQPKSTRVQKKLSPCQKASSRRNDRKSKRFERSVKCIE